MSKQNSRRNLQRTHRRRQRVERAAKIVRQQVQRAPYGLVDKQFDHLVTGDLDNLIDNQLFRHGARRWTQTIGLAEEVERAERAAGWDPNP